MLLSEGSSRKLAAAIQSIEPSAVEVAGLLELLKGLEVPVGLSVPRQKRGVLIMMAKKHDHISCPPAYLTIQPHWGFILMREGWVICFMMKVTFRFPLVQGQGEHPASLRGTWYFTKPELCLLNAHWGRKAPCQGKVLCLY